MFIFKVTEPSPLQDSFGVRQKKTYPDPPPGVPHPESIAAQAAYAEALLPGSDRPEMFPGIGVLPGPATESHVVNRGTPVAPLDSRTAAECPGEEESPAWEAPAAQISQIS